VQVISITDELSQYMIVLKDVSEERVGIEAAAQHGTNHPEHIIRQIMLSCLPVQSKELRVTAEQEEEMNKLFEAISV